MEPETYDVALIGGGIMSATLAALVNLVEPAWKIVLLETAPQLAQESSGPWNNAGTGHAGLCELNYTPQKPDGSIDTGAAFKVAQQFFEAKQFWAHLVETGKVSGPQEFITKTKHMSLVHGEQNAQYLQKRWEAVKANPLFEQMQYTRDVNLIQKWAPLLTEGRTKTEPIAATLAENGADIDFGELTEKLIYSAQKNSNPATVMCGIKVNNLKRSRDLWEVKHSNGVVHARFVFVGAGGGTLELLQKAHVAQIKGYAGFPVSGKFWRTTNREITQKHRAKVYGQASVGAPPMSVPHLDDRIVHGEHSLVFGPFAGFSPKFLKTGSLLDGVKTIKWHNVKNIVQAGWRNKSLVAYLIKELLASENSKLKQLQSFYPQAKAEDWEEVTAGQRVQIIKHTKDGAVLQFGTEVITDPDRKIAGLLGASPGASTAVSAMAETLLCTFPENKEQWTKTIQEAIPTFAKQPEADIIRAVLGRTNMTLGI